MLTLKYVVNEDGSVIDESKDFIIHQHESGNVLVLVSVPKESLIGVIYDQQGEIPTPSETKTVSSVSMGASMLNDAGELVSTGSEIELPDGSKYILTTFRLRKVKDYVNPQGKEFTLFQRRLPKAFVLFSGTNSLTISAVNILFQDDGFGNVIKKEVGSIHGQVPYEVVPSNNIGDVTKEPSELDWLQGQIDEHETRIDDLEDWQENEVNPKLNNLENRVSGLEDWETNTVTPTLQDHKERIEDLETNDEIQDDRLESLESQVNENMGDISALQQQVDTGFTYIGTIFGNELSPIELDPDGFPTDDYLNNFVFQEEGRQKQSGDKVYYIRIQEDTDTTWTISYSKSKGWQAVQIPPLEAASNKNLGSIRGTYIVGATKDCIVDISAGVVQNIYIKNRVNSAYTPIRDNIITLEQLISNSATTIQNIIDGVQIVGKAQNSNKLNNKFENELEVAKSANSDKLNNKLEEDLEVYSAERDKNDEVIDETYRRKDDSYSKNESDTLFAQKSFQQSYYISEDGLVRTVPETPIDGVQFSAVVDTDDLTNIMRCLTIMDYTTGLTSNQTINIQPFINITDLESSGEEEVSFSSELRVAIKKQGDLNETDIAVVKNDGERVKFGEHIRLVNLSTPLNRIAYEENINLQVGDQLIIYLSLKFEDTISKQVDIICNNDYPSTVGFITEIEQFTITNDAAQYFQVKSTDWILNEMTGLYEFIIDIPPTASPTMFWDVVGRKLSGEKAIMDVHKNANASITLIAENAETIDCWLIGGIYSIDTIGFVKYDVIQVLSPEEKDRARANIGAIGNTELNSAIQSAIYDSWQEEV